MACSTCSKRRKSKAKVVMQPTRRVSAKMFKVLNKK